MGINTNTGRDTMGLRLLECEVCNEMARTTDPGLIDVLAAMLAAEGFDFTHFVAFGTRLCDTALGKRFGA